MEGIDSEKAKWPSQEDLGPLLALLMTQISEC